MLLNLQPTAWSIRSANKSPVSASVLAAFLIKLAKHMAVLSCLLIVGTATGKTVLDQFGIFLMVVAAALAHIVGRALERRAAASIRLPRSGP